MNLIPDVGSLRLRKLLEHFGNLERLWQARSQDLEQVNGIGPGLARQLVDGIRNERVLDEELALVQREGVSILTRCDANYPKLLKEIHDPPLVLYVKGSPSALDEASVAIVGSRRASLYGLEVAERLAYDLALRGVAVVSGVARGIDGAAHRGAL
ncbi:MAG: DNA-processing protein DprA, partial [Candidatus Omnitrophica bacterium]|nr:DNA-processing protein DprA [Candidatus Omnitrophota bacterium]